MSLATIRDNPTNVLDHGFVRIVDWMGDDLAIVRAARVSYNADWRTGDDEGKDSKLIRRLLRDRHTSPFECVTFTFEFKMPMFVRSQHHRHRTWAYSEVSARYSELPEEFYVPEPRHIGKQSETNKQARDIDLAKSNQDVESWSKEASNLIQDTCDEAFKVYKALLARGVPRELARSVLPVSTYTRFFGTVNLHNLLHFLNLRLHPHAQYEIRVYAEAIADIISHIVPVTMGHYTDMRLEVK